MAKPRIFISSTCYDLSEVRDRLCSHLELLGMEAVASDTPTFGVAPGKHSHEACLDEVDRADYLVLIVGGRRGGTFVGSEKSITNEEYKRAARKRIPILSFIRKRVMTARAIYKSNTKADVSHFVDDPRVFDFVDVVQAASESNWVWEFEKGAEICDVLTVQFAHIVKLYSERVVAEKTPRGKGRVDDRTAVAFPGRLTQLPEAYRGSDAEEACMTAGLRTVHKALSSILASLASGKDEKIKTLWLLGRYGDWRGDHLWVTNSQFKQFAWSTGKGRRVFEQLETFGVLGEYDHEVVGNDDVPTEVIKLAFEGDEDGDAALALSICVKALVDHYGEDAGLTIFGRADMTLFS